MTECASARMGDTDVKTDAEYMHERLASVARTFARLEVAERMAQALRIWQSAKHHMPGSFAADFAVELRATADVLSEWEKLK